HTRSDRDWSSDVCSSDLHAPIDHLGRWAVAGLVFGIASLSRFQATGLLIGTLVGTMLSVGSLTARTKCAMSLVLGAALPLLFWRTLLLLTQGYVPDNYNF